MAIPNRAAIIGATHKVLKKHYKTIVASQDRTLLENLLYAHCLQNATYEKAEEAFSRVKSAFFDWNEVRVTTVSELAEVVRELPNAVDTASNIKGTLQSVFESAYSFDIEELKKQNIGKTVKQLGGYAGVTDFAVAYVTQHSLGGHAIPLDSAALDVMYILGAIDEAERTRGAVPGLERAIPKRKGIEFASLLHQVGADLMAAPFTSKARSILVEISPDARAKLPKRATRKGKEASDGDRLDAAAKSKEKSTSSKKPRPSGAKKKSAPSSKSPDRTKAPSKKKSATKQLAKRKPR